MRQVRRTCENCRHQIRVQAAGDGATSSWYNEPDDYACGLDGRALAVADFGCGAWEPR